MDRRTMPSPLGGHRHWLGAGALALLAGALLMPAQAQSEATEPRVPVAQATRRPVGQALVLDGLIEAQQQATLAAQASGRIVQLHVKAGDRVRSGQVLAVIDD
ncbi:MAG: biotin/lipoyl-binding protein, partial [Tepidimonas sp.]|uniref:biotin/lipoyl-binding protein n=1 Tax=Tepidimonas sp. TaxID=2002775 RepID=UPI00298F390E